MALTARQNVGMLMRYFISNDELQALQDYAADLLKRTAAQLDEAIADGTLQEITDD